MKICILGIMIFFCMLSAGFSQDKIIIMDNKELGIHQRPLVEFPHEQHEKNIKCIRCHHDFDNFMVNQSSEGRKCSECHTDTSLKPVPLIKAFHLQCKGCHLRIEKELNAEPPVMCGQCHVNKN